MTLIGINNNMFETFFKFLQDKGAISISDYKKWTKTETSEAQVRCVDGRMRRMTETTPAMCKGFIVFY